MAHDTVWVWLDGQLVGSSYRGAPRPISLPAAPFAVASSQAPNMQQQQQEESDSSDEEGGVDGHLLQLLVWPMVRYRVLLSLSRR